LGELLEHKNEKKINEPGPEASWPQMTDKIQDTNIIISAYLDLKYTVQSVVFDSLKAIEIQKIYQEIC
jgi:hypothetical protein